MPGIRCPACLWILFLTLSGFVCSDTVYIERNEGDSVTLSCEAEPKSRAPIGVYLKRGWLRPGEVLFQYSGSDFTVANSADRNRTTVSGDPSQHRFNITMSRLRPGDTDRYHCDFIVSNPSSEDESVRGKTDYFLLVSAGDQCGCSTYSSLLYVLSSAVAVLLLLILIGFVLLYKGKARRSVQPHPHAPIYEEMVGVQQPRKKLASCHLDEMQNSEYRNCSVKKSCPENPYETPRGRNIN
uniref:Uncharacterized LOC114471373 n=1 Tax=Gouania willdenowi TaxID=441366 RepID=A0A8C5DI03_GOUWI